MSCKRDLFSNEFEVLGLLKLTPIPGYAGTPNSLIAGCATLIPVTEKVNHLCTLRCCKTVAVIRNLGKSYSCI